jgi:hypothetical protein
MNNNEIREVLRDTLSSVFHETGNVWCAGTRIPAKGAENRIRFLPFRSRVEGDRAKFDGTVSELPETELRRFVDRHSRWFVVGGKEEDSNSDGYGVLFYWDTADGEGIQDDGVGP